MRNQAIRGIRRKIPEEELQTRINAHIHNRFDIEVIDTETGKVRQRAQAENVICSQLWTRLLTPNSYFNYIHYGTGSGTPSASDTSLFAFYAAVEPTYLQGSVSEDSFSDGVFALRRNIQLGETDAVGVTITEIGIGYSSVASSLCTHAMLKDMNGNAISIAKTSTDIINVYATVYVHWVLDDAHGITIVSDGQWRNNTGVLAQGFMMYLAGMYNSNSSYPATVPSVVQFLDGVNLCSTSYRPTKTLTASYSPTEKKIVLTCQRLAVSEANFNGIHYCGLQAVYGSGLSVLLDASGSWYTPGQISGEAVGIGDGTTSIFKTAFPIKSGATVYVNGVAQTDVNIHTNAPVSNLSDMGVYFIGLDSRSTDAVHIPKLTRAPSSTIGNNSYDPTGIYYNPYYLIGIESFYTHYTGVQVSNDLITWIDIATASSNGTIAVPESYRNYKYWKVSTSSNSWTPYNFKASASYAGNVVFTTPPASGAVITADYIPGCIAKDVNYVFDLTVTITLGEYSA